MKRLDSLEASYRCCWWGFWLFVILLAVGWLTSCTTTNVTENAHSLYKSDSTQIQRLIDTRIRSIQQQMDSVVTTTLDSLGREIRQEQRTISRDISREQQIIEQRLTREFESRLQTAISELDSSWQSRYDSIQAVTVREDSIASEKTQAVRLQVLPVRAGNSRSLTARWPFAYGILYTSLAKDSSAIGLFTSTSSGTFLILSKP